MQIYALEQFTRLILDDGTGVVRCVLWTNKDGKNRDFQHISLGDFIEVRGRVEWRDKTPLINVESFEISSDPHAEVLWWAECKHTYETVYLKKFKVGLSPGPEASLSQRFNP